MYNMDFVRLQVLGQEQGGTPREQLIEIQIDIRQKLVRTERRREWDSCLNSQSVTKLLVLHMLTAYQPVCPKEPVSIAEGSRMALRRSV